MTVGFAFILACLILVPCVFLFSGRDTDHLKAIRKECQRDALLDWTDKDLIAAEHDAARPAVRIETVSRESLIQSVA